ncbi:MAG: GNAT family N-acetyltransferase [Desertimonas sp.]
MPVRVLWLTKGLGPGGAERLLVELARTIDPGRVELSAAYVLAWKDHLAGELEAAGVRTVCLSHRRQDPAWPLALRRLLDAGGFDIVHAHSPVPAVAARVAIRTLPRARRPAVVTTEHNTWTSHHRVTRWANRWTGGGDAATFAVTAEAAASVRGTAAGRVEVLTHGIDVTRTAARPGGTAERIRAELGIDPDESVIGIVANFRPQKDHATLLAAARRLADTGVAFRLVIVGQGPLAASIAADVDRLGLDAQVVMAGYRADALDVMSAFDVFTLSSAWEGLPVAVMEALALGLPIVATRVGGVAESLDETAAVLVPRRDPEALAAAWRDLLGDPLRRAVLSAGGRRLAGRFDIARASGRLTEVYESLVRRPRPAVPAAVHPPAAPEPTGATAGRGTLRARIRPATPGDREAILELLGAALGWTDDARSRSLFAWKHDLNPFGPSYGWVADDGGRVVGVRLFMRWRFRRGDATIEAVRAVDTATHPDHRGQGLFRELTMHGVEQCRSDGVGFVFNTPNDQSRPGYLSMGWRRIGRLPTSVRPVGPRAVAPVVRSRVPAERWSEPLEVGVAPEVWLAAGGVRRFPEPDRDRADRTLRTDVDDGFRAWRYGMLELRYRVVEDDEAALVVRLRRRGAGRELVVAESLGAAVAADRLAVRVARDVDATHVVRLGGPDVRHGFMPMPGGGPVLTWRALNDHGPPPLSNWALTMRDIELF